MNTLLVTLGSKNGGSYYAYISAIITIGMIHVQQEHQDEKNNQQLGICAVKNLFKVILGHWPLNESLWHMT